MRAYISTLKYIYLGGVSFTASRRAWVAAARLSNKQTTSPFINILRADDLWGAWRDLLVCFSGERR